MFFLLAISLVGAGLTAALMSGFGLAVTLASVPIGASLGAAIAGCILAWQTGRHFKAASQPGYVRASVGRGLRDYFAGAVEEPLPSDLQRLSDKLSSTLPKRRVRGA